MFSLRLRSLPTIAAVVFTLSLFVAPACSSSTSSPVSTPGSDAAVDTGSAPGTDASTSSDALVSADSNVKTGGPVSGAIDAHCTLGDGGKIVQETTPSSCHADGGAGDGGAGDDYPPPMFNAEADDDDCKYHLKWSVTSVTANADVTFSITVTNKGDGTPVTGAAPALEAFLDDTHPAPNSGTQSTESSPGTYTIGPVRFDASGQWTVRFHFFEECTDAVEDSPHSHASFFVAVP